MVGAGTVPEGHFQHHASLQEMSPDVRARPSHDVWAPKGTAPLSVQSLGRVLSFSVLSDGLRNWHLTGKANLALKGGL